jgi:hypothetical protein
MSSVQERRRHPRLPLHLSVAKLIDFQCEGQDQTIPAVLVDLSAGGLSMVAFALPRLTQKVTFRLDIPGLVNAQLHGHVVRATRKGETYQVAVAFDEFKEQWTHMINKLIHSIKECDERWNQGDRTHCPKDCAYHKVFPKEEA